MGMWANTLAKLAETECIYLHVLNRAPIREYRNHQCTLGEEAHRALDELTRTGMALSHVDRFPGLRPLFEELRDKSRSVEQSRKQRAPANSGQARTYAFTTNLLGSYPIFDPDSAFARFACHTDVLGLINAYFGMFSQLRKYAVFRNIPTAKSVNSSWHRDGVNDTMVFRLFAYFQDIGERNGATLYACGTHKKGPRGSREVLTDAQLEQSARSCAGPEGTLLFVDTRGYHRAGDFSDGERWLFNAMYTSPGFGADYFRRKSHRRPQKGDPVAWALSSPLKISDAWR